MSSGHEHHHVIPFHILRNVALALIAFTLLTVLFAKGIHLGAFGPIVAFAIAGTKAYLVMSYFMGLKYDVPSNRVIFGAGFFFLALLWVICALDIWTRIYQGNTL